MSYEWFDLQGICESTKKVNELSVQQNSPACRLKVQGGPRWLDLSPSLPVSGRTLPFDVIAEKAESFGYDGIELPCWGDHFDVTQATGPDADRILPEPARHPLQARSQDVRDQQPPSRPGQSSTIIDERHKPILPPLCMGRWRPRRRESARRRGDEEDGDWPRKNLGVSVVNGFTGSSIWHLLFVPAG